MALCVLHLTWLLPALVASVSLNQSMLSCGAAGPRPGCGARMWRLPDDCCHSHISARGEGRGAQSCNSCVFDLKHTGGQNVGQEGQVRGMIPDGSFHFRHLPLHVWLGQSHLQGGPDGDSVPPPTLPCVCQGCAS